MTMPCPLRAIAIFSTAALLLTTSPSQAEDGPQWGERLTRNMVSDETGLPDRFDPETGENVLWSAAIGSKCYSTPVVAGGRVFIGTNNDEPRDAKHEGDRGVLMCFDATDGSFQWQLVVPKLSSDIFLDWPHAGMCSPPTVQGDRVYTLTNRDEVVCLDIHGMANGNDGPFLDEGRHMAPADQPALTPGPLDADIIWILDLRTAAGVRPHDSTHASILIDGDNLYLNTSNGLNSQHKGVEKPEAPSLVVVDKRTGTLLAEDREKIGRRTFHANWSSPALAEIDGTRQIVFAGNDGVVYGFDPLPPRAEDRTEPADGGPIALTRLWRFDCDPTAPKENVHSYVRNRAEGPSSIKAMPVVHDGRVYVTAGGDIWWGKRQSQLLCFDPAGQGDLTESGLVWSYAIDHHCCATPSVSGGLVYVTDCAGMVHCVDAKTGKAHWVHDAGREMWSSTLVADGKIYVGTRQGIFWVLAAGKEKKVLSEIRLDSPIISTAVAADGVLYVCTSKTLYAVKEK